MLKRRSVLSAFAFASLLVVLGGAAFAIRRGADSARREVASLHEEHVREGEALASIRANVFLGGILTRDYLLDPDPSHAARYVDQFTKIRADTERSFRILAASGQNPREKATLDSLHAEVDSYWDPTKIVLNWTPREKEARRGKVLQERVRHREEIVALAAQVERLITANFSGESSRITGAEDRFRTWLAWTTVIALLLGAGIAAATVAHIAGLERRSVAAEAELLRLSGQIRVAQEQERRYLSRELHDQAGQMLTGLRMELASISHSEGQEEFAAKVAHAKGIVEQALRIVRNIAMMLRPSMLDDLGLVSALGWLIREMKRSSGIEIHAEIDPALDSLPDAECTCVYRIAQEALTNAAKHSGARRVDIVLEIRNSQVSGSIADNGRGFDWTAGNRSGPGTVGLGIVGMEERMQELGGSLRVSSSPGYGTRVQFRLPCPQDAEVHYAEKI